MKTLFLAFLIVTAAAGSARADIFDTLSSADKDKYVHFCAGTAISHVSYPLFRRILKRKDHAWLYSFGLAAAAGIAKEMRDKKTTGFSGSDLLYGVAGAATIVVVKF